jgi:hypothetical protein
MSIVNKVVVQWEKQDPTYSYQGSMEFTPEEFRAITDEEILARQTAEYDAWYANIKSLEQEQ